MEFFERQLNNLANLVRLQAYSVSNLRGFSQSDFF